MNAAFFLHYYVDDCIKERFKRFKKLNKDWDVYSIGFEGNDLLVDSLIAKKELYPQSSDDWCSADLLFCESYRYKSNYDNYFFLEYDTIFNVPILDFFDISDDDFLGSNIRHTPPSDWIWIKEYEGSCFDIDVCMDDYGDGGQTTCCVFNNKTLKFYKSKLVENKQLYENMFSELRLGTILKKYTTLKNIRPDILNYVSWDPTQINVNTDQSYFYHPVK